MAGTPPYPDDWAIKFAALERRLNAVEAAARTRVPFTGGTLPEHLSVGGGVDVTGGLTADALTVTGNIDAQGQINYQGTAILPVFTALLYNDVAAFNNTLFDVLSVSYVGTYTYALDGYLIYDGTAAADIKHHFTAPGCTLDWARGAQSLGASAADGPFNVANQALGSNPTLGCLGVGTKLTAMPIGTLVTAGTDGFLTLQMAQQVTDGANPSTLYAGSWLRLQRL